MVGPPPHPDTGPTGQGSGQPRWKAAAVVIVVVALLAVMVVLHLTGTLGAGSHG